ncbi:MAG: UDP-N-acetylglucosamine pyrophosphorylase [Eubacteriales bacterium]|nr:UDP-N-acetylglucosamine pyrophosphorylase [Eubacteriales bacterium]
MDSGMDFSLIRICDLLDLSHTIAGKELEGVEYPWQVLSEIGKIIIKIGSTLDDSEYDHPAEDVWISRSAKVAASASVTGPVIVGHKAEIRHCAFIRGNALIGENTVVGNSTELKNVILFDNVQVPHYNYVGDSILGYKAHMGAGAITSNVKSDKSLVKVRFGQKCIDTGMKKFGAILGDQVEIGCNSVMNPGTIVGRNSNVYPLSMVRGFVPANSIHKNTGEVVFKSENR